VRGCNKLRSYSTLHQIRFGGSDVSLEALHVALDILGFIPGYGEWFDGFNGIIYTLEGDYLNAGFSVISLAPVAGDVAAKGLKYSLKIADDAAGLSSASARNFSSVADAKVWIENAPKYGGKTADVIKECGCFSSKTLVLAENGSKLISELEIDEQIWTFNESTGELELNRILAIYTNDKAEFLKIEGSDMSVAVTKDHPFFVAGK